MKRERDVANNLAAGGIQTARANFDGVFVAPEASVTVNTGAGIFASGSIRYVNYRIDGFREAGAADNLSVAGRDLQVINGRFQLSRPFFTGMADGPVLLEPYIGIEASSLLSGSHVDATLLGQAIRFSPGGESHAAAAFAGLNLSANLTQDIRLFGNAEVSFADEDSASVRARVGFKFRFWFVRLRLAGPTRLAGLVEAADRVDLADDHSTSDRRSPDSVTMFLERLQGAGGHSPQFMAP